MKAPVAPLAFAVALTAGCLVFSPSADATDPPGFLLADLRTPHGHRLSQGISNALFLRDLDLSKTVRLTERPNPRGGHVFALDVDGVALLTLGYRSERLDREAHLRAVVDAVLGRLEDAGLLHAAR